MALKEFVLLVPATGFAGACRKHRALPFFHVLNQKLPQITTWKYLNLTLLTMDPLSISASALTIIAATITTVKTLNETVGRYKGRDKTLARLQGGLHDLISILKSLEDAAATAETPILALLKGPVSRCAQVSREFEDAMKTFGAKSKPGLKDWAKMEFMRGDINEFIDTLADYKSTITIGLGTINM